ncbi:MAG: hypothetical protein FWD77_09950 [Betaproteobacteria bacterium]|nr:hypothetical protein [Betaproteobacteria bacterium]
MRRIFSKCLTMATFFLLALAFTMTAQAANNFQVQGGSAYDMLWEALVNVPDGGKITMLQDVSQSGSSTLDRNIT